MRAQFRLWIAPIALVAALGACNSDPKPVTPPSPPPPPPLTTPPLTTPVGTNVDSPVTQTIGSSGGTVTAGGIKLEVLPDTVSSANITLQPITDTLNGSGQGIAISGDAAWSKYAKISFPITASDDTSEALELATHHGLNGLVMSQRRRCHSTRSRICTAWCGACATRAKRCC